MEDESRDEEAAADSGDDQGKEKPWYPYITKTQFEKFLSRLQSKIPDEIDRDYVRTIIRTPSMIYRFLRGVEAMGLIDDEQRPTDRLRSLVDKETRKHALGEVVRDLYPALTEKMQEVEGEMPDRDIVAFFRKETGMGNDSANKMKMFYKYLLTEADGSVAEPAEAEATEDAGNGAEAPDTGAGNGDDKEEEQAEAPQPQAEGRGRGGSASRRSQSNRGGNDRGGRGDREEPAERGGRGRGEREDRGGRGEREERPERSGRGGREERPERGGRGGRGDRGGRSDRDDHGDRSEREAERVPSNRPLTEAQKAYLDTLKSVLRVTVDGDWDDDMIRLAFDRLERLFDRIRRG